MASVVRITEAPITVTATGDVQPLFAGVNVGGCDVLDLLCGAVAVSGSSIKCTLGIITGMQLATEEGWVLQGTFSGLTAANQFVKVRIDGPLPFVRWRVESMTGTAPQVTFVIWGIARQTGHSWSPQQDGYSSTLRTWGVEAGLAGDLVEQWAQALGG